jgi:Bacterial RNA polymerase, alpha chain C terminal domain/Sigma-70, region 4
MSSTSQDGQDVTTLELSRFDLSTRTTNCLANCKLATIGDLAVLSATDILAWRSAGRKTLDEIRTLLGRLGLKLRGDRATACAFDPKLLEKLSIDVSRMQTEAEAARTVYLGKAPEDVQKSLLLPMKSITLSVRAQGVVKQAGATFLGDLAQKTYGDIVKIKNAGRKTATEISEILAHFGLSLGLSIPDWSRDEIELWRRHLNSAITEVIRSEQRAYLATVGPEPETLEEELHRFALAVESERNAGMLESLWGWHGEIPRTLESVGREFRLTRERVRQIEAKALRRLRHHQFESVFVAKAVALFRAETPDVDTSLAEELRRQGVSRKDFSPWSVQSAAEHLNVKWPFEMVHAEQHRVLALAGEGDKLRRAIAMVRRKTSELGCTNIYSLASELHIAENRIPGLVAFLDCASQVEWLDSEREWLYLSDASRNRLFNLCSKVLGVCDQIRIAALRRAVSKSRRLVMCPPQRILAAFIERQGMGRVEDEIVYATPGTSTPPAANSNEGRMLKVLDEHGPVMDGEAFAEECVAAGMNATSFYIYRMISPVISSLGKNVYCKAGADVPPGSVEQILATRRSNPTISDHGWTADGKLWFGTELSLQVIVGGGIRLVKFVSDFIQGEWRVLLPDGTEYGTALCNEVFIRSFRKPFALLGAESGDFVVFEFDLRARSVLVRVGGPSLFESIQDPENAAAEVELDESDIDPPAVQEVS